MMIRKDNSGVSLVEIVVVLAILSVVTVASVIGVRMISGMPATACVECLQNSIQELRTVTMGKKNAYALITVDVGSGAIMFTETIDFDDRPSKRVGTSGVSVQAVFSNSGVEDITAGNPLKISFKRETGGLEPDEDAAKGYLEKIIVTKAGKTSEVEIKRITGKINLIR